MASGKKNYFRHSFFARNNTKLLMLRDSIGVGYYFYYFSLLELCGEQAADEIQEEYVFHDSIIRSLWRVNLKKSERIATEMNSVGLLEFKKLEKSFSFRIPNQAEWLGKYQSKIEPKGPNKRKENKRKENKIKNTKNAPVPPTPDDPKLIKAYEILDLWNKLAAQFSLPMVKSDTIGKATPRKKRLLAAIAVMPDVEDWKCALREIPQNPFNLGQNDREWIANLDWLIAPQKQNYLTLCEKYKSRSDE